MQSKFELVNRGFKETLVLVPGWATDSRIFTPLDLDYNYLVPLRFSPLDFTEGLREALKGAGLTKVSLFGWSQGGFLAAGFAAENPDKVDELILLNIRKRFKRQVLEEVGRKLQKNKKAYLYKFYLECFSGRDQEGLRWFRDNLLKDYLENIALEGLISGLEYFSTARIDTKSLSGIKKVRLFHGEDDRITPKDEAGEIKAALPQAEFILLPCVGHISFLNRKFKEKFYHG